MRQSPENTVTGTQRTSGSGKKNKAKTTLQEATEERRGGREGENAEECRRWTASTGKK